jgi:hypothetical protein
MVYPFVKSNTKRPNIIEYIKASFWGGENRETVIMPAIQPLWSLIQLGRGHVKRAWC